jgi:hypothetical protein
MHAQKQHQTKNQIRHESPFVGKDGAIMGKGGGKPDLGAKKTCSP